MSQFGPLDLILSATFQNLKCNKIGEYGLNDILPEIHSIAEGVVKILSISVWECSVILVGNKTYDGLIE